MSRMYEPRLSEGDSNLAQTVHEHSLGQTVLEREQLGRLYERPRLQLVNCMNSSALANRAFNSGNCSSMSAFHGISHCDEVLCLNLQPTPSPYSKLSDACNVFGDCKHLALHERLLPEEPLLIQCGENTALMYVSKLCQGSKGPCILFQNEWLTPNELQFISGRETAKDWKRSIRYKGRSLKSLISRGLLRVHPPICDCLGCRISLPLNRSRLADKCGDLSATSLKNTREIPTSVSSWRDKQNHSYRHVSSSDIKHSVGGPPPDASIDQHDSNSTSASECSDNHADENAFYYEERPRSVTSPTMDTAGPRKRRSSDSSSLFYQGQEKHFDGIGRKFSKRQSAEPCIQKNPGAGFSVEEDTCDQTSCQGDTIVKTENTSAFHTVHKDQSLKLATNPETAEDSFTCSPTETLQRKGLARTFKTRRLTNRNAFFPSQFSQCLTPPTLIRPGQTSPGLVADPYLLASHASKVYQRAGIQPLPQRYMHYGFMAPMHQNLAQTFQSSTMLSDSDARASVGSSSPPHQTSHCASSVSKESSLKDKDAVRKEERHKVEESSYEKAYIEARVPAAEEGDKESATHNSPASSPGSSDNPNSLVAFKSPLHKRVPRLHVDLSENVLGWNTDDVCHFVSSITKSMDISQAFREENIDGHSLVLIREEHLLDRMSVKLGPALKILAQINKLVENMEIDKEPNPTDAE